MKKVLSTVLAGTMVFGMSSAAFAASTIVLKDGNNTDHDYYLQLYVPAGGDINQETTTEWDTVTQEYFDRYVAERKVFLDAADISLEDNAVKYLQRTSSASNVMARYTEFYAKVKKDTKLDSNAYLSIPNPASDLGISTFTVGASNVVTQGTVQFDSVTDNTRDLFTSETAREVYNYVRGGRKLAPDDIKSALKSNILDNQTGRGEYRWDNKSTVDISGGTYNHHLYTYGKDGADEVKFKIDVKYDEDFRVDVAGGKATVSRKRVTHDKAKNLDQYIVTIKPNAGVRDFELSDWKVEMDLHDANRVYFIEGDVAYSDYRDVEPDSRYIITKSNKDDAHDDGCVFNFDQVIDSTTRIVTGDYCDLIFKGNYGTDFENLRVVTDSIKEVEDFFKDYDINYYDFVGTPKFAKEVTVRIDADSDAYIYEFDKQTGDVVDITDECDYTSDGMTFNRKVFKTYVVLEEAYEGGNTKVDKDDVVDTEPAPEPTPSRVDDGADSGKKPNPGTGAIPA